MKYDKNKVSVSAIAFLLLILLLITGMSIAENTMTRDSEYTAEVISVDNSRMEGIGLAPIGSQLLTVEILNKDMKGEEHDAINALMAAVDMDTIVEVGDKIVIDVNRDSSGQISSIYMVDFYRQGILMGLFILFAFLLVAYAGKTGIKALVSFIATLVIMWFFLIPRILSGVDVLSTIMITIILLAALIIYSVAGFSKMGTSAFLGTISGIFVMMYLTINVGHLLKLNGFTAPYADAIIYRGYFNLNMQHIFYGSIMLGASGAVMDIAMDTAASIKELKLMNPALTMKELVLSGFNIGRAVIGTMTTTLLLAYSGGYLTLLIFFYINNTSLARMLNMKIVSAEIMRTLIGSIGLVIVAPITAIIASWMYTRDFSLGKEPRSEQPV